MATTKYGAAEDEINEEHIEDVEETEFDKFSKTVNTERLQVQKPEKQETPLRNCGEGSGTKGKDNR